VSLYVSTPGPDICLVTGEHGTVGVGERVSARFALVQTAPRQARRILDAALAEWGLGHLADAADLITSELVTNACAHGAAPAMFNVYADREADGGLLFIEVEDAGGHDPNLRAVDDDAEDGRGLQIVDALAEDWGCEPVGHGKRVWASLAIRVKPEPETPAAGHDGCPCGYAE
jgi:anti-sigma regulatory factor (Ser/Thr protein kinase)